MFFTAVASWRNVSEANFVALARPAGTASRLLKLNLRIFKHAMVRNAELFPRTLWSPPSEKQSGGGSQRARRVECDSGRECDTGPSSGPKPRSKRRVKGRRISELWLRLLCVGLAEKTNATPLEAALYSSWRALRPSERWLLPHRRGGDACVCREPLGSMPPLPASAADQGEGSRRYRRLE